MARLLVSGPRALFRRPEFTSTAISYDVITPWAARRIFEAVHWTPSIWWRVEKIHVLRPIMFEKCDSSSTGLGSVCLKDVSYLLEAHFEMTEAAGPRDNPSQHAHMFKKRAKRGEPFQIPYLGRPDMPAKIDLLGVNDQPPAALSGTGVIDLGWMIYDRHPSDRGSFHFFRPTMVGGMIDITAIDLTSLPR